LAAEFRAELDELHETQADLRELHRSLRSDVAVMRASFHGLDHFVSYKALVASLISVAAALFGASSWVLGRVESKLDAVQASYVSREQLAELIRERPPWVSELTREALYAERPRDDLPEPPPVVTAKPGATARQLQLIERLRRKTGKK
jgi:hypothetical protein